MNSDGNRDDRAYLYFVVSHAQSDTWSVHFTKPRHQPDNATSPTPFGN